MPVIHSEWLYHAKDTLEMLDIGPLIFWKILSSSFVAYSHSEKMKKHFCCQPSFTGGSIDFA